jgi:hypothetical protein
MTDTLIQKLEEMRRTLMLDGFHDDGNVLYEAIAALQPREIPVIEHEKCRTQSYVARVSQVKDYIERQMGHNSKDDAILRFSGWITVADARRLICEPKRESIEENGKPYLYNRGDGVDGRYCIARYNLKGRFSEFWHNDEWCSAGQVFHLGNQIEDGFRP